MRVFSIVAVLFWSLTLTASLSQIDSAQFYNLAKSSANRDQYVKFVVFVDGEKLRIEYFDSRKIDLHVDYLKAIKGTSESVAELYQQARLNSNRKYFFGALLLTEVPIIGGSHFSTEEELAFQITAEDPLSLNDLIRVGDLVKSSARLGMTLHYRPSGNQAQYVSNHEVQVQLNLAGLPLARAQNKTSIVYYEASSVGRLVKVMAKDIESGAYLIKGDEILILDYVPDSLPPVRGVITSQPTSPNSHVALLANMYSIPFIYIKNAQDVSEWTSLNGKPVLLKTELGTYYVKNEYVLEGLNQDQYLNYESLWLSKFPKVKIDIDETKLQVLTFYPKIGNTTDIVSTDVCGAKAANGSLIAKVLGTANSIEGFCIPFAHFHKFMTANSVGEETLRNYILKKVNSITTQTPIEEVQGILADIKEQIQLAKVDSQDIQSIKKMIVDTYRSTPQIKRIRFRSSSNAEDDEQFNGAGLYESDGLNLKHVYENNDKKVVESLKIVWSSLYNLRAVLARKMFHIDESKVYMGILVNQAFAETANGVSLCSYPRINAESLHCNIEGFPGGELSVAHPTAGKVSEILNVSNDYGYIRTDVKQYTSELGQFETLMTVEEVEELFSLQERIYRYWSEIKKPGFRGSLDFEWKKMEDSVGKSYMAIKQVREVPRKLTFSADKPTFVIPSNTEFSTDSLSNAATLVGLFTKRTLRLSLPLFTLMSDTQKLLSATKIFADDYYAENLEYSISNVSYVEGAWYRNNYDDRDERVIDVIFETQHPTLQKIMIKLSYSQKSRNGMLSSDNFVDPKNISLNVIFPSPKILGLSSKTDPLEILFEYGVNVVKIPERKMDYCKGNNIVATTTQTEVGTGIYEDGPSYLDSILISKDAFKAFKNDTIINDKKALVSMHDSHAFEDDLYMDVKSIFMAPAAAKAAGLKSEEYYVVIAQGRDSYSEDGEAESEWVGQMVLFDKNKKIIEKVKLTSCSAEE